MSLRTVLDNGDSKWPANGGDRLDIGKPAIEMRGDNGVHTVAGELPP